MSAKNVYLKCERNAKVKSTDVFLKDIAHLRCLDNTLSAKLKSIKVFHFEPNAPKRCVISTLKLIELMETICPDINVQIIGETDVLIECIAGKKQDKLQQWIKIPFVCLVSFFGTAFTIMAYHNDVGINEVFTEIYTIVMNQQPQGVNILEISYSIGLAAGIIIFFNHVGGRRITKDPTPIEVAMRNYEQDVDKTLIETAERKGKEEDV